VRVYIGYDSKQPTASKVCEYSLRKHSSTDLDIIHLDTNELKEKKIYFRPDGDPSSTEFTYSRFLVPFLEDYKGHSIFVDSDFLFLEDINKLMNLARNDFGRNKRAAYCVKHLEYKPKSDTKFYGKPQLTFPKKNWSSLIMFNNEHPSCKKLNPMTVANKSPQWLHRFEWLNEHNEELSNLPITWNWLVGEYNKNITPNALHFTNGGPFNEVYGQDYENVWNTYLAECMATSVD
jgi:hypothetical protein